MFKLELKYKKFKLEQEEGGSMFDEQWQFAVEVEREYAQYRKKGDDALSFVCRRSRYFAVSCK